MYMYMYVHYIYKKKMAEIEGKNLEMENRIYKHTGNQILTLITIIVSQKSKNI